MPRPWLPYYLFGLAALLRVHNAWVAPPLSGFDGPYHAAYIAEIFFDGRVQLPHGFSNHPPLYYLVSAGLWQLLPESLGHAGVLFSLRLLNVLSGLAVGAALWVAARRLFPDRPLVAAWASGLALFVPMYIGPSALLGNQMMSTALAAWALVFILRALETADLRWAGAAGLLAGLGVLTKMSVLIVVAVGGLALLVFALQPSGFRLRALVLPALFGLVAASAASPHFVRNVVNQGVPIDPQVDLWAELDRSQGRGTRAWGAYLDFHPGAILRPGSFDARPQEAVWPVTFASTWFDLFGTSMDLYHPNAQRAARALYVLGAIVLLASGLGFGAWGRRAFAERHEVLSAQGFRAFVLLALLSIVTLLSYVSFTHAVATYGALKGTYLSAGFVAFALFAGLGFDALALRFGAKAEKTATLLLLVFVATVMVAYWHGGIAPLRANPADFVMRDYSDPPSLRAFRFFAGREVAAPPAGF